MRHNQTMPPRSSLTSSFPLSDQTNEVVCPLKNNDGSNCRKRCLGVSALKLASMAHLSCSLWGRIPSVRVVTSIEMAGEALSLDARAHSPSASSALYSEASCDRRELPAYGEHPAVCPSSTPAATATATTTTTTTEERPLCQ